MFYGAKDKFRVMLQACSVGKLPSFSIQMVCRGYHFYGEDCFVIFIQLNQYLRLTSCINDTSFRNTPITLAHYSNSPFVPQGTYSIVKISGQQYNISEDSFHCFYVIICIKGGMLLCRSIVQKLLNMRVSIGTIIIRILKAMQTIVQILFLNVGTMQAFL